MAPSILWLRRDLRLADHPALHAAAASGPVVPLFVVDPALWGPSGAARRAFLAGCLRELRETTGGALVVRTGDPVTVVPGLAGELGAAEVHVTGDAGVHGRRRDDAVAAALAAAGCRLVVTGTPYAVAPGSVRTGGGQPYKVFTPFSRGWRAVGWPAPLGEPDVRWQTGVAGEPVPEAPPAPASFPPGEAEAHRRLDAYLDGPADRYDELRNRPDLDATSRLSPYLRFGCLHPRQVLARLGDSKAHGVLRSELAWREFYADVLWHQPWTARESMQPKLRDLRRDHGPLADERFRAWAEGRTGYPIVDAGMRQLLGEGWMHNRVRMITASFLVKDLHLPWQRGARWFMERLVDGDLASNQHGWQWVAGTGTDAAPFFRIFNPVAQGERFDPDGDYVRRWVPELRAVPTRWVHAPWTAPGGGPAGYPAPIVDHAAERAEALRRYGEAGG